MNEENLHRRLTEVQKKNKEMKTTIEKNCKIESELLKSQQDITKSERQAEVQKESWLKEKRDLVAKIEFLEAKLDSVEDKYSKVKKLQELSTQQLIAKYNKSKSKSQKKVLA